ncbi:MAG: putative DNA binding domain-containing protein [Candidatus Poribacteria bacterium]|nr:putative DNA binding domain-containing protein [Candidatus Poribacteria bacterium]
MNKAELIELIRSGENSGVEFKRDEIHPDDLAKEFSAMLNFEGGKILLGVENDGHIKGLAKQREEVEQWVMNVARGNLQPEIIPYWSCVTLEDGKVVGVVGLPADSPGKPYKAKRGNAWVTFVRVGSTSREATRGEEGRLYQASRMMRYDISPVPDMGPDSFDLDRIENYFRVILQRDAPDVEDGDAWRQILLNIDLLSESGGTTVATVAGLLIFGEFPNRRLPQAGITAAAYPRKEKDYDTVDEELIRGPLVSILSPKKRPVDKGVIDRAVDFVERNMGTTAWLEGGRRERKKALPKEAVRESIVNAVVHRDYTIVGTDIEISLYQDRLEVISPGRLPNGVSVEKMKEGLRAARNELLKEILRDYGYVEHLGMGVRNRIIQSMRDHNGTEPDLIEDEYRFTVRLWKQAQDT